MTPYYAHSGDPSDLSTWQPLREHLRAVAVLARQKAEAASPADGALAAAAWEAGWLHDLGKYRDEFQDYLKGLRSKGDPLTWHKQAGAAKAACAGNLPVALVIAGHHGGLPDKTDMQAAVKGEHGMAVADEVWPKAIEGCSDLKALVISPVPIRRDAADCLRADLFTRLLFSCLVDADWADTGEHERRVKKLPEEPAPPELDPGERFKRVEQHIAERASRKLEPHVKQARADVLAACLDAADRPPGLFALTVPTGGGKTLSGLAFALKHAAKHAATHGLRRVIYVAPYMTILEQNADVIRAALGVSANDPFVFEHYSLAEPPGDEGAEETALQSAARRAENWDAPVVVTTNVQFFESLFSNKPGRCRKLHNIARSVIILDECQTLPPGLVAPTCGMLKQLAADLRCTVVLCTATQPAFDHDSLKDDERLCATEIIPEALRKGDEHDLFVRLKRARVSWPKPGEVLDWPDVAARMLKEKSALCVVNTKKAARAVFEELKKTGAVSVFHLSTAMCPQHRREKLAAIRSLLAVGAPCYVVSTQLIEAGVDIDFPFVMRELAPLEAIIQAAGRGNREGRILNAGGRVLVFRSVEGKLPKSEAYKLGRDIVEVILAAKGHGPQLDDLEAIRDYFVRLFHGRSLDAFDIRTKRTKFQFTTIAQGETDQDGGRSGKKAYRLIDDAGEPVVVETWKSHATEIASLLKELEKKELEKRPRKSVHRALARFQVNLLPSQLAKATVHMRDGPGGLKMWTSGYDDDVGITEELPDNFII